jgi:beta-glucosidase
MQGNDPNYYKTVACAKHFAVHSGPEPIRHEFNAIVSDNDLYNTYLPAFRKLVVDAKVGGIMCAYNRTDSFPCCNSPFLLQDILRNQWGFKGYVVTDCWALDDIFRFHKFVKTPEEAAATAIKNGVNVECGNTLKTLRSALDKGLLTEADIDASLKINLEILMKMGWFDPVGKGPYDLILEDAISQRSHRLLARATAVSSMVLLSNKNKVLPLSPLIKNILVTGPNADDVNVLLANYNGSSGNLVTILEGITEAVSPATIIMHNKGCELSDTSKQDVHWQINEADAVVAVLGLSPLFEGENGDAYLSEAGGDKKDIRFPYAQLKYLRKLREKTKKPIIVVLTTGSAIELAEVEELADAVLLAWYPGEQGGNAVADILFGNSNPGGRLPVTFYKSNDDLPAFTDYSMKGRTYRYFQGKSFYPFGYGLGYTSFRYSRQSMTVKGGTQTLTFDLKNTGKRSGDEVVQLYIRHTDRSMNDPVKELRKFKRIGLNPGETKNVRFELTDKDFETWDQGIRNYSIKPGAYEILIGSSSEDIKLTFPYTYKVSK